MKHERVYVSNNLFVTVLCALFDANIVITKGYFYESEKSYNLESYKILIVYFMRKAQRCITRHYTPSTEVMPRIKCQHLLYHLYNIMLG